MQRHHHYTRRRLHRLAEEMRGLVYRETRPIDELLVSDRVDRITLDEAQRLESWRPARCGEQFGPLWATYWFRLKTTVPDSWRGGRVDLLWSSHSEATLWMNGRSVQGLNFQPATDDPGIRPDAVLVPQAAGGETIEFQIEMACNKLGGENDDGTSGFRTIRPYVLDRADIALFDDEAWQLYFDFLVLQQLEAEHARGLDPAWDGELLAELNRFANAYDPHDRTTWATARAILAGLYAHRNGTCAHGISAIGHAHIDTAWLWPLAETRRKCERSFSTAVTYMDSYPEYRFACSQAQQYAWMKETNPDLYERIRTKVKAGQFVPVGGTWVEPDCNLPSGESMARQFLHGQRFFEKEFGVRCREFWNPDVFGYNGQLPQLCRLSGITRFLTVKLAWNHFNKPVHQTFTWEGIDGSEVLTHFPPAGSYNSMVTVEHLRRDAQSYKDHDRSRHSYMLFGYGDGGGGPTKRMLETLRRVHDLQGVPRTEIRNPDEFFGLLEADCTDRARIVGELYFELHRGCYTTQAAVKRGNRRSEQLLHDVEFISAAAAHTAGFAYPAGELDRTWKLLLMNQFHDILPGSSIGLVYEDARRDFARIEEAGTAMRTAAACALAGDGAGGAQPAVINTIGFARAEVADGPEGAPVFVEALPYGVGHVVEPRDRVALSGDARSGFVLENAHLRAELGCDGSVRSLVEKSTGRETLAAAGNMMLLYEDKPNDWEAWDVDPFHMETERECPPAGSCRVAEQSALRAGVAFEREIGLKSQMVQTVRLAAGARHLDFVTEVDWHEDHTMLKVAFPVNVRAMTATYEMPFGICERPTHFNTPYDLARYEVPGHRWIDLGEHGFGVALLNDCKYGFSVFGGMMRISLLRSPKNPDPNADMGHHRFAYAIMPHAGGWREAGVVAAAMRFNAPVVFVPGAAPKEPVSYASVNDPNLVLDTIKQSEDGNGLVLRLYECHGARGTALVRCALPFKSAVLCNILEEEVGTVNVVGDGVIEVSYAPFKILSLLLK